MKSLNLLVTKDWQVKVCDFGLSRFNTESNQMRTMTKLCGTYAYLAPEMFKGTTFTASCDIWSCGVVLWEIGNRVIKGQYNAPFYELNLKMDFQILYQVAEKGARPTHAEGTPDAWRQLVDSCLSTEPEERPTATELTEVCCCVVCV
jgi:serine/threonine protein kinase